MPKRRFMRRNVFRRRKPRFGRRKFFKRVRRAILRISETKYTFTPVASALNAAAAYELATYQGITQGSAATNRIGNKIRASRVTWRIAITCTNAGTNFGQAVFRCAIVHPVKGSSNGDVLANLTATNPGSLNNFDPTIVKVVRDKFMSLGSATTTMGNATQLWKGSIRYPSELIIPTDNTVDRSPVFYICISGGVNVTGNADGFIKVTWKDV